MSRAAWAGSAVAWLARDRGRRWAWVPATVVAASLVTFVLPQRDGPFALFEALAPVVYGALLLLVPLAIWRRSLTLLLAVMVAAGAGWLAYHSPTVEATTVSGPSLTLLTWNLHGDRLRDIGFADVTARLQPDVLLLEEAAVRPGDESLISAWPYRIELPNAATPPGMVILSRLPIEAQGMVSAPTGAWDRPRAPWIRVTLGGKTLTIVGVHLEYPWASLPCPYCPDARDTEVHALVDFARQVMATGQPLVVAGDFNFTEREPAYRDMAAVLEDAAAAGGATWTPLADSLVPPLLRLDYVWNDPELDVAARVACDGSRSDHCPVVAQVGLTPSAMGPQSSP
jgi:endonuclease/exonuclease/phosphatase family metal-dependent hydrolase